MINSPITLLVLAGLSLAGTAAVFRRRGHAGTSLSQLSTAELETLRRSLNPDASVSELRRATLILVEEETRRRQLLITHE